ncbi:hypothetical protein GCM10009530_78160 [Microbispora corallina]|uniref:Transport permease protein n=1 Tax=Microbispora corallina TaxID=83302 RepID=A0ABQ4GCG0_9ACTN|nr:hypothetical protein Mco01_77640 [Microbispora corallina]
MNGSAIAATGLRKAYKDKTVLDGIDLDVRTGGMRRKLDLAMTLVGEPQIIFLDEPTTGLDPRSRRTMWEIIRELVARGTTIFLTTQYLEEADELADRIAVLDQGRLVAEGTADQLKRQVPGSHVRLRFTSRDALDVAAEVLQIGVALLMGFRPSASLPEWLGAIGIVVLTVLAMGWLTVAFGLAAKTPESAGLAAVPLMLLPFLSSAFVPADKMGAGARQFAEYQPFISIIEALRGLLTGAPSTGSTVTAVAWCVGLTLVGYLWARRSFTKRA